MKKLALTIIAALALGACASTATPKATRSAPAPVTKAPAPTVAPAPVTKAPAPTVAPAPVTKAPAPTVAPASTVHGGSFCSPEGATGVTEAGTAMVCSSHSASGEPYSGGRNRWRPAA